MTGLPTLAVYLEDGSGNFTNDITSYVELAQGWDFRRGRNDEDSDIEPAVAHFTLTNRSGEFTLGASNFNGIAVDKRIQVKETVGGTTYTRFTGWTSALGNTATARITAVDRSSRLNRRKLKSITEQEMLADSPFALYTLGEASGSTSAGDTSGNGQPTLTPAGTGAAPAFGEASLNAWDGLSGCTFAGGQYLSLGSWPTAPAPNPPTSGTLTIECAVARASTPGSVETVWGWIGVAVLLRIETSGAATALLGGTSPVTSSASVCDGNAHATAVTISTAAGTTTIELFVDGVSQGTASTAFGSSSGSALTVGNADAQSGLNGSVWLVGLFASVLSSARILAHANAIRNGFATDTADQRIARLAAYDGIPTAEQNLETGQAPSIAPQATAGQALLDAMEDVAAAEGGVVFIQGDGKLALHNRAHRIINATSTAALSTSAANADDNLTVSGDKNYLFNTATGTRVGGADQRAVNAASVAKYGEYPVDHGTLLVTTDEQVLNLLNWQVNIYGTVTSRVSGVSFDLATLPQATVQALLAREIGDHIQLTSLPSQVTSTIDLIIEGIKEEQRLTDKATTWKLTFNTAPAQLFYAPIVDTAGATCDTGYPVGF
jgi:hypothetical protein